MFRRSWVRIPALYTGWSSKFFTYICCKNCNCLLEKDENNEKEAEFGPYFKKYELCKLNPENRLLSN